MTGRAAEDPPCAARPGDGARAGAEPAAAAARALAARLAADGGAGRTSFGGVSDGNRANGRLIAGTGAATVAGKTIARTVAPMRVPYGSESATRPTMPNQKRLRREPSTVNPDRREPVDPTPANAGVNLLSTSQPKR